MAKEAIQPARTKTAQVAAGDTHKDQKAYQMPEEYSAQAVNQEFDRVHGRINALAQEALSGGEVIEDLLTTATLAEVIARSNLFAEILRNAGLLRRTK